MDRLGELRPRDKGEPEVHSEAHEHNEYGQAKREQHEDLRTRVSLVAG